MDHFKRTTAMVCMGLVLVWGQLIKISGRMVLFEITFILNKCLSYFSEMSPA